MKVNNCNEERMFLIAVSAKTSMALIQKIEDLYQWICLEGKEQRIQDISYTLLVGRSHFSVRLSFLAKDIEDLKEKIIQIHRNEEPETYDYNDLNLLDKKKLTNEEMIRLNSANQTSESEVILAKRLQKLYMSGSDVDWRNQIELRDARRIPMPTYPFAKERYWILDYIDEDDQTLLDLFARIQNGEENFN